jgi:signal transduction histidine kinase
MQSRPRQNQPFHLSRRRLAAWYTGVMTLILMACGFVIHRVVVHARWLNLVQEMQQLAIRLENRIEPALQQPGQIDTAAQSLLPNLCLGAASCAKPVQPHPVEADLLSDLAGKDYCIRFIDRSKQVVASLKLPSTNPTCREPQFWQTLKSRRGEYYHVQLFPLHVGTGEDWGLLQIARSLNDLDLYLMWIELALVALILLGVGLVGCASWWLAGLAMRPVEQSYQQMQQFTADAAHELRTPLAALQAIVQTALRSTDLTLTEARAAFQILNRQNHRLSKLVQDLLILSQMDQLDQQSAGQTFAPCCLNQLIQDLADEFAAFAIAAQIQLTVVLPDQPDQIVQVAADSEQLYRAIANLLSNAIRYTPAQGKVTVRLSHSHSHAVVQVEDTGIGISTADQSRIFNRFYRVDQGRSQDQGGSGLGLAIAQAIVQRHRGSLSVVSELGQGSQFTMLLPTAKIWA